VVNTAGALVPEIIGQIRPAFELAVSEYREALQTLPEDTSSDALVAAGPSTLAEYLRATTAAASIAAFDEWLSGLVWLPAFAGHNPEAALRVLKPTNRAQLHILTNAQGSAGALNPLYVAAVRNNIEFEIHTPAEASEIRQLIEAQPVERRGGPKFASL
jgi:hypothetical protein